MYKWLVRIWAVGLVGAAIGVMLGYIEPLSPQFLSMWLILGVADKLFKSDAF